MRNKEKFEKIFYPIFYLVFSVGIAISACFIYQKFGFLSFYVSGRSMRPTLIGEKDSFHYGIADTSKAAISTTKRFEVVVTYYSWVSGDENLKVKRVWGLPGETISLTYDNDAKTMKFTASLNGAVTFTTESAEKSEYKDLPYGTDYTYFYRFTVASRVFNVVADKGERTFENHVLGQDEYFVMGDNWSHSSDCYGTDVLYKQMRNLNKSEIVGKVVRIEGTATGYDSEKKTLSGKSPYKHPMYIF